MNLLWAISQSDSPRTQLLRETFRQKGAIFEDCPVFLLEPTDVSLSLKGDEILIFVTRLSVSTLKASGVSIPASCQCFAVGQHTAEAFQSAFPGIPIDFPLEASGSENLYALMLRRRVFPRRVYIFRGSSGREWLAEALLAQGFDVKYVTCYERRVNPAFRSYWMNPSPRVIPEGVVLMSTESLEIFLTLPKQAIFGVPWVSVLPGRMGALAKEYGYPAVMHL